MKPRSDGSDRPADSVRPRVNFALGPPTLSTLLALAFPAMLEQLLGAGIGITDAMIAGHVHGTDATRAAAAAAVGAMSYLQWFCGLMASSLGVGATALVARSIGGRRIRVANRVAGTALSAAFLLSLLVSALLFWQARAVVRLCGLHGLAGEMAVEYLQIMVVTISFQVAGQIGMACLRGAGDTLRPMWVMGMTMLVNALASSFLTFGGLGLPALGVRGNALGTLLAYLAGGVATVWFLFGNYTPLRMHLRHLRIVPHVLMKILRIGLPTGLEGLMIWGGQIVIVILVINGQENAGVWMAAHNTVIRIESLSFLPGFGFGMATAAMVGQYLGASRPNDAWKVAWLGLKANLLTMTLLAVPMVIGPRWLLGVLVDSRPVLDAGYWPMILAGLAQPGFSVAIVLGSALRGAGETFWPMIGGMLAMFLVRVPLVLWVFCGPWLHLGLTGVWLAILVDLNVRGLLNWFLFVRGRWVKVKLS